VKNNSSMAWIDTGVAAIAIAAIVYALRTKPIGVDVAAVTRGPMAVVVEEEGRTRVKQVYAVSAPIIGRVLRPTLDVGDPVIKDETVVAVSQPTEPPFLDRRSRQEIEAQISAAIAAVRTPSSGSSSRLASAAAAATASGPS
jgi:HlyD family secretion protein